MAMQPTWDETEPLFDETEDVNQGSSLGDTLKSAMNTAQSSIANTPMGLVASGMDMAQKGADVIGEKGAEELARGGMNPTLAAGIGTVAQMGPQIISSTMPTEGITSASTDASTMAPKLSRIASDARIRGFRVPGSAIDQTGELQGMRESVETLKGQGIQPKVFETAEDLGNRVKSGISEFGQAVRDIPKKLDQYGIKPRLNNETLPQHLEMELQPKYTGGANDAQVAIAKEIAETSKGHSDSFQALLDLKQQLGEQGKFYRVNTGEPGAPLKAEMYQKAYGKVAEIIKNEINAVAPEFSDTWAQANEIYGSGKDVLPHLTREAGKSAARNISDVTSLVKSASRSAIAPMTAYGADTVSKIVQSGSQALGKFGSILQNAMQQGPKAFAVAHYTLSQREPEYRDMIKNMGEDQ